MRISKEIFENYEIALFDKRISVQDLPVDIRYSIDFWVDYTNKHSYSILSQFKYEEDILPVISELIKLSGLIMFFLNDDFKENRELVLSACRYSGESLTHLKKYQDDEEVVMVALKSTGRCFSSVSKRLQNKKAIALIALKDSPFVYDILSKDLQNDVDCIIASLQKGRSNMQRIKQYANNVDVMLVAIETDYTAIKYLDVSLRKNEQILEKLKSNIKKISPEQCPNWLWENEELLIERVRAYPETVKFLGEKIENNIELLKDLVRANSRVYHGFTEKAQENLDVALQYVCYSFSIMGFQKLFLMIELLLKES